jgi:hypothetical protein
MQPILAPLYFVFALSSEKLRGVGNAATDSSVCVEVGLLQA